MEVIWHHMVKSRLEGQFGKFLQQGNIMLFLLYFTYVWGIYVFFISIPLLSKLPYEGLVWLIIGGTAIGVFFYFMDKKIPYNHAIWHICVLLGSFSHFMSIFST